MDQDKIKGNWREIKGKLRQKWGKLTDNEITSMQGSYEELSGKLQKIYGYQKDKVQKEIDAFLNEHNLHRDRDDKDK